MEIERLSAAIDWLTEAAETLGANTKPRRLGEAEQSKALTVIADIQRAIAPRRLPVEIEWFWKTWDPASFGWLVGHPPLTEPSFALETWERDLEWPRALFWVAYESHCFLGVELDYDGSPGPRIYYDCYASGEGLRLRAPDLATMISGAAAALESGEYETFGPNTFSVGEGMIDRCHEALDVGGIGRDERGPFDYYDLRTCPERWRLQVGVDDAAFELRGASCTIAELHDARRYDVVEATIVGRMHVRGGQGSGRLVELSDDTGRADIWIPSSVPNIGGGSGDTCEIDVVARPNDGPDITMRDFEGDHSEITRRALSGDMEGAAAAGRRIGEYMDRDHPIVAKAVRLS